MTSTMRLCLPTVGGLLAGACLLGAVAPVWAAEVNTSAPEAGMVRLNFPTEVELKTLADYVSGRLGIKILYDEEIANKKVSLRAPGEVPVSSLLGVLQSALKMKGLALIDADVPGWKRVVGNAKLAASAPTGTAQNTLTTQGPATVVTQVFVLKYIDTQKVDQAVKTFLTPGANSIAIKDPNVLIVTDYAQNLLKIAEMVELLDRPKPEITVRFVPVQNMDAPALAQQITSLLSAKTKAQGDTANSGGGLEIASDARTNQLVLVGGAVRVEEALGLVRAFDVPLGLETASYSLKHTSPERVDRLARQLLDPAQAKRLYQSATDSENGVLLVTTTPAIHAQIRMLTARVDTLATKTQSPIRFYKLKNTTVDQVMETLRAIEDAGGAPGSDASDGKGTASHGGKSSVEGAIRLPLSPGQQPPTSWPTDKTAARSDATGQGRRGTSSAGRPDGLFPGGAKITADANTNSLIVLAEPPVQRMYEELIASLDRRRPQVLIEAKVIAIDTSNSFSLGVEISRAGNLGIKQLITFSSFGLSTVSPVSGALALTPGTGFNGALIDPNSADAVLRALCANSRARVLASPRVLVNDNSKGELQSVLSVPFASVNASQTVATTSVGGNQDAGTTITVTPHISEGDHLQLEFSIESSSFSQNGNANLPPPRHIDKVQSTVTIPDGHTVIVGGLNRNSNSESNSGLPFLEDIPGLRWLFGYRSRDGATGSLFIFLRPTILRDDKFKDLKFISETDTKNAQAPSQFPASAPILMR